MMKNVLITRFSALGDVAIAIPVIYDVARQYPDSKFFFITRKHPANLFINPPDNLTVIPIDTNLYKGVRKIARLFSSLHKQYHFDVFVDLHDVLRTQIMRLTARAKGVKVAKIHKGRSEKKALTRPNRKAFIQLPTSAQRYRAAFHRAGFPSKENFKSIFSDKYPVDPEKFATLSGPKSDGEFWVGIAPFAMHKGKIFPLGKMKTVVGTLAARPGYKIFLFGFGPEEEKVFDAWADKNIINVAKARIGLKNETHLIASLDVMISMDSANMHIASLTATRAISIWGATHPFVGFLGSGQKYRDIVQLDMICRPCSVFGNKPCRRGDYQCLNAIPVSLVIDTLDNK